MMRFELLVSYHQIVVFRLDLDAPFNDWTEGHTNQGFAWRPGSVGFATTEIDPHEIEVLATSEPIAALDGAVWHVEVPFEVPPGGQVGIASVGTEDYTCDIAPGRYQLRYECTADTDMPRIRLVFTPCEDPQFRVLRVDPDTSQGVSKLLLTADPA
jgi:Competence protein J (ComJ)